MTPLRCDKFTSATHTTRHNILRDMVCAVTTRYGITTSKEPTIYKYQCGKARRPDALFHVSKPLVTDFTIVTERGEPGDAAAAADDDKKKTHVAPTKRLGHIFYPAACETRGLVGKGFTDLKTHLARELPSYLKLSFYADFDRAISVALAKGRAAALFGVRHKMDDPASFMVHPTAR